MRTLLFLVFLFGIVSILEAEVVAPNGSKQIAGYRTSWVGNSFGGLKDGNGCWVQQDIAAMHITPDGTVYTNVPWEEAGGNCSMYKDGKMLGSAKHTHGWGFNGGSAVTANEKYVFIALSGNNENGGLNDPDTWPPKGFKWYGVSRRLRSDFTKGASFEHGKGGKGDTLPKSFLVVNEVPLGEKDDHSAAITGLWADQERLYVGNPLTNKIEIYDAETMLKLSEWELSKWNFSKPGQIAADPFGHIWIYHSEKKVQGNREIDFHTITQFDRNGEKMSGRASDEGSISAVGPFCFGQDNRMFVFNGVLGIIVLPLSKEGNLPDAEQILSPEYRAKTGVIGLTDALQGSLIPHQWLWGEFGNLRFRTAGVNALGCDAKGNLYIAQNLASNGGGTVLESYRLSSQTKKPPIENWEEHFPKLLDAELNWRLFGLCFIDGATLDPTDETIAYTKEEKFKLDWSQSEPGTEWTFLAGTTVEPWSDPRFRVKDAAGVWVRKINGYKFLFVNDMNSRWLQVYALPPAGEELGDEKKRIGVPLLKAFFAGKKADFEDGEPQNRPKEDVAWIYSTFYSLVPDGKPEPSAQGWWVDTDSNVWRATETQGIYRFTNPPDWSYENRDVFPHPAEFTQVKRIRYDTATDTLYLGGCTAEHKNQHWKPMGAVVCRYDNFLKGSEPGKTDGKLRWKIVLPYVAGSKGHESCEPMGFDIAGDYLFAPYTGASKEAGIKTGHIEVYRLDNGQPVGWIEPDPVTVGEIGLQDMRECLSAHRLKSGEYIIFLEDDYKAKVVMFRWKP